MRKLSLKLLPMTTAIVFALLGAGTSAGANSEVRTTDVVHGLMCIHHYEGSWTDPNPPYWGGLQMDLSFQAAYGWVELHGTRIYFNRIWGTADHWPVWAQLQAGINAYQVRGWNPWPNTARDCGLL